MSGDNLILVGAEEVTPNAGGGGGPGEGAVGAGEDVSILLQGSCLLLAREQEALQRAGRHPEEHPFLQGLEVQSSPTPRSL